MRFQLFILALALHLAACGQGENTALVEATKLEPTHTNLKLQGGGTGGSTKNGLDTLYVGCSTPDERDQNCAVSGDGTGNYVAHCNAPSTPYSVCWHQNKWNDLTTVKSITVEWTGRQPANTHTECRPYTDDATGKADENCLRKMVMFTPPTP